MIPSARSTVRSQVTDFCENCTLHGFRYLVAHEKSKCERAAWLIFIVCGFIVSSILIQQTWQRWDDSPMIISMDARPLSVRDVVFPAVTICNMNRVLRYRVDEEMRDQGVAVQDDGFNSTLCSETNQTSCDEVSYSPGDYDVIFNILDYIHYQKERDSPQNFQGVPNNETVSHEPNFGFTGKNFEDFLWKVTPTCYGTMIICKWLEDQYECMDLFSEVRTDYSYCCSFNSLPKEKIVKHDHNIVNVPDDFMGNISGPPRPPFRGLKYADGSGYQSGLSIVMDVEKDEYYYTDFDSVGFKVLVHNPEETPKVASEGFVVAPGDEVFAAVTANVYDSVPSVKSIAKEKRNCLFDDELFLRYYRKYSLSNCEIECRTNLTVNMCNCRTYYMPVDEGQNVTICGTQMDSCVKDAIKYSRQTCRCLPSCTYTSYITELSSTPMPTSQDSTRTLWKGYDEFYIRENLVLLHVFFKDPFANKYIRSELYGSLDFIANTGGILGLFLGFSFLSGIELFYFFGWDIWRHRCNCQSQHSSSPVTPIKR